MIASVSAIARSANSNTTASRVAIGSAVGDGVAWGISTQRAARGSSDGLISTQRSNQGICATFASGTISDIASRHFG